MTLVCRRVALLAALLMVAGQADAQQRQRQGRARMGQNLSMEALLRSHERLELSSEQIQALEAMQEEEIQQRRQAEDRFRELRSQLRAGEITREQLRDQLEGVGEGGREAREARAEQVRDVLTEEQLDQLSRGRRRAARAGGRAGSGARNLRRGRAPRLNDRPRRARRRRGG